MLDFKLVKLAVLLLSVVDAPPTPAPTFEVKSTQSFYQAEEKQNVTMEWTFPPPADGSLTSLNVTCWKVTDVRVFTLLELVGGVQVSESEDEQFAGRVHCDTDVLKEGRLRLHVSSFRIEDSGRYVCNMTIDGGRGRGESLLIVSVHAKVGDDVVLPVHIETKLDTSAITVSWKLNKKVVHTCRDGRDYLDNQNENFKGRTSMFEDEIAEGNVFKLLLENVTKEDSGTYNCTVITEYNKKNYSVSLYVELRASTDERKDVTTSPPPTSPPPTSPPWGLIAGGIGGIVVVIGVILGVFLYKRRCFCRNNRNIQTRGQQGADGVDETELDNLSARQDQVQNDLDDQRCPTEAPGETDPLSDPPNRDAPLK